MTRDDIRNLMYDYFDGYLPGEESKRVQSFLEEYEDVAEEYRKFGNLLEKLKDLPTGIAVPPSLIDNISDELLSLSVAEYENEKQKKLREISENKEHRWEEKSKKKEKVKSEPKSKETIPAKKISKGSIKLALVLFTIVLAVTTGYFTYNYLNYNLPWNIKAIKGFFQIDNQFTHINELNINQTLTTLDTSVVRVNVPEVGWIDVQPNSSIVLRKGSNNDNEIFLAKGGILLNTQIDNPPLEIITRIATIEDLGGNFSVRIDDNGSVIVTMRNGLANLITRDKTMFLIQGYRCKILSNGAIGIPFHSQTSDVVVEEANLMTTSGITQTGIDKIINAAGYLDGITLWHLLKRVNDKNKKLEIFTKLDELFPKPPGVTQNGILTGNEEMMQLWHKEIEWQI